MQTLEDLRPSRSWEELLGDVRRRGATIQRRRLALRVGATLLAVVVAVVLPLSAVLMRDPAPGHEDLPPPVSGDETLIPPRPVGVPNQGPARLLGAGPAPRASQPAGAPPVRVDAPASHYELPLFVDLPSDVRSSTTDLKTSGPAIDLRRGGMILDGDAATFWMSVTDMSVRPASDLCQTWGYELSYHGVTLVTSAVRGSSVCAPHFDFFVRTSDRYLPVRDDGRFDDATNTVVWRVSLDELNRVLPARSPSGATIPRIGSGVRYPIVFAQSSVVKQTGPLMTMSDPRNSYDQASNN